MKKYICLLIAVAFLLTGCGGSTPEETVAPTTEPIVTTEPTTEPTTIPTEPKTFFEEQGFEFWEGFKVYDTLDEEGNRDGGLFAEANILDSAECKVTITSGNREEITYCLADTKVDVWMDEYTLDKFDEACKNDKSLCTVNIKNASDNLYEAFKEEDSSLTKEAWLDQYREYKVIHSQIIHTVLSSNEVSKARLEMGVDSQSGWKYGIGFFGEGIALMNSFDGSVLETENDDHPGVAEFFEIKTESESITMAVVADLYLELKASGQTKNVYFIDDFFVMVPADFDNLTFILPLNKTERTMEEFEEDLAAELKDIAENPWEQKTFAEYTEGKEHLKYYFLSPFYY